MKGKIRHIALVLSLLVISILRISAQLNTDRITAIGRNALYFDDYVLSIQYFNQVIKLKPYLAEPYLLRAIAKIQLSDYYGGLKDLDAAIERNPFHPGAYYTRGFVERQLGQYAQAEKDFSLALHHAPENKTYLLLRADVRAQMDSFRLAQEDLDYLLRRDPQSSSVHFEKGVVCLHSKDTAEAIASFRTATDLDPRNTGNWSALGMAYLMGAQEDEALDALTHAIDLGSKWAGDYMNRGIVYYRRHNYRGALSDYDRAVALEPNNAQTYFNRGVMRQEVGDLNNALEDLNRAIELEPDKTEMLYHRAVVLMELRQWQEAIDDFDALIARYPYFLPSYYLSAQAHTSLGHKKEAFSLRQTASQLEEKKDSIEQAAAQQPQTDIQLAEAQPQKRNHRKEFSTRAAQNQEESGSEDNKYASEARGAVQKRHADVINEPNIALSYYSQQQPLRRTNYFHYTVDQYNRLRLLPSPLRFTVQETTLTAEMVSLHFDQIARLSTLIDNYEGRFTFSNSGESAQHGAALYLARAIEFALVQDYTSATDDCTKAILLEPKLYFAYFLRANWRYKQLEYLRSTGQVTADNSIGRTRTGTKYEMDVEIMLRDYDYVITHQPDFSFAYYNKANMLCSQKEYQSAIQHYTKAIEVDNDFAEAWFNRGLTRIFIGEPEDGIQDLSKAGELGIYQAYNLITRFQ